MEPVLSCNFLYQVGILSFTLRNAEALNQSERTTNSRVEDKLRLKGVAPPLIIPPLSKVGELLKNATHVHVVENTFLDMTVFE